MRLWTLHPRYLDAQGLVALWREALLAQAVLRGRTVGYRSHPQLIRFRAHARPVACIAAYLRAVHDEATARGYDFDRSKIARARPVRPIRETNGQLLCEWEHLARKLRRRDAARGARQRAILSPDPHPLFRLIPGPVRDWERAGAGHSEKRRA